MSDSEAVRLIHQVWFWLDDLAARHHWA